jgi:hypothetical protein
MPEAPWLPDDDLRAGLADDDWRSSKKAGYAACRPDFTHNLILTTARPLRAGTIGFLPC